MSKGHTHILVVGISICTLVFKDGSEVNIYTVLICIIQLLGQVHRVTCPICPKAFVRGKMWSQPLMLVE